MLITPNSFYRDAAILLLLLRAKSGILLSLDLFDRNIIRIAQIKDFGVFPDLVMVAIGLSRPPSSEV